MVRRLLVVGSCLVSLGLLTMTLTPTVAGATVKSKLKVLSATLPPVNTLTIAEDNQQDVASLCPGAPVEATTPTKPSAAYVKTLKERPLPAESTLIPNPPTGQLLPGSYACPNFDVGYGWLIYAHFTYDDLCGIVWKALSSGLGVAAGYISALAGGPIGLALAFIFTLAAAIVYGWVQTAIRRGGGIVFEFTYWLSPWGYEYVGNSYP